MNQKTTTNYSMFVPHETNRLVISNNEFKLNPTLLASMKREGFRKICPIICKQRDDGKLVIIDGHNRFAAASALNIPIEYIAYPEKIAGNITPSDFSLSQKTWSADQYIHSYASQGIEDYIEVIAYAKKNKIPLLSAAGIFLGNLASDRNSSDKIKQGLFKIKDRTRAQIMQQILSAARPIYKDAIPSALVSAFSRAMFAQGFDYQRMIDKIEKFPEHMAKKRNVEEYMQMLELVYNRMFKGEKYLLVAMTEKAIRERDVIRRKGES